MTIEATTPRSRRALLGAGLAALGASVAQALARPADVAAANGDIVHVGDNLAGSNPTIITNTTNGNDVWKGVSTNGIGAHGVSSNSAGVHGESTNWFGVRGDSITLTGVFGSGRAFGVFGTATEGSGVEGHSVDGTGVSAYSQTGQAVHVESPEGYGIVAQSGPLNGVLAFSYSLTKAGVHGWGHEGGPGVVGASGGDLLEAAPAKTGVYGYANQDTTARGVFGESPAGQGVRGVAATGIGVRGFSASGVAGSFETTLGIALATKGRLRLANVAGRSTIASGTSSVVVNPGLDLTASSFVLATLNGNAGTASVRRVAVDATANTFTIYLTANATSSVKVAWLILEE